MKQIEGSLLSTICVSDNEFENAFREKSFPYNSRNMRIVRYILGKIEHAKGSSLLVTVDDENASVEHILPKKLNERWDTDESKAQKMVFRLGNTCFLERKFNRDLQNDSFEEKKKVYSK